FWWSTTQSGDVPRDTSRRRWQVTFHTTGMEHSPMSATGTGWERTPWHATQQAAWDALRAGRGRRSRIGKVNKKKAGQARQFIEGQNSAAPNYVLNLECARRHGESSKFESPRGPACPAQESGGDCRATTRPQALCGHHRAFL